MKSNLFRFASVLVALISLQANAASELQNYVQQCQNELHFNAGDVPAINCSDNGDGYFFAVGGGAVRDRVAHKVINNAVDLVAACRWELGAFAASIELLIHNRQNGSTCFFAAKDTDPNVPFNVSTAIVSPTNFGVTHPNADDYWLQPSALNSKILPSNPDDARADKDNSRGAPTPTNDKLQCVGCHVEGPYIASQDIAPFLNRFGLLNDGHDTIADLTVPNHYHAVGSGPYNNPIQGTAFGAWDSIIFGNMTHDMNNKPVQNCSGACHSIGDKSSIGTLFIGNDQVRLLGRLIPSLKADISLFSRAGSPMPPIAVDSDYRWINRDTQLADGIDIETFTASQNSFPVAKYNCSVPTNLEAHAVGSDVIFSTAEMGMIPDKLKAFNLRDGLVCLNADQPGGRKCYDYAVSYKCGNESSGAWTPFYNQDTNATDNGDHEERTAAVNAKIATDCGSTLRPLAIKVNVLESHGFPIAEVKGPNDKLQEFIPTGLICKNSDQSSGSCSNYVVRYSACRPRTDAYVAKLKNQWVASNFTNRFLTTTNNVNGAETRAQGANAEYPSQDWIIENISGGNTVRLYDVWSGKYLTTSSDSDLATVVVKNSDTSLRQQQWVIETVSTTNDVRFRNLSSGRYLTVGNYTGTDPYYAPIISQALSNQNWTSQRWVIQ